MKKDDVQEKSMLEKVQERKLDLEKGLQSLTEQIELLQRNALATQGAIQQCDWQIAQLTPPTDASE